MPKEKYMKEVARWFKFLFESDYIININPKTKKIMETTNLFINLKTSIEYDDIQ